MPYTYIKSKSVRQLVKDSGKRCGKDFLQALDKYNYEKILRCIKEHNGNRKTLDGALVNLIK